MPHRPRQAYVELFLIACVFGLTFGVVLPWYCQDKLYSLYFKGHPNDLDYVKRAMVRNEERLDAAVKYFQELHINSNHKNADRAEPADPGMVDDGKLDLTIAIITAERNMDEYFPRYWIQTLAQVHKQYTSDEAFKHKRLFLCNVNEERTYASELSFVSAFVDVISRFGGEYPDEKFGEGYTKTKEDYAFCLKQAAFPKSTHVLVLEDDVLLRDNFFADLYYYIFTNIPHINERNTKAPWALVKLFYPEKWSGYSFQFAHVAELVAVALTGGLATCVLRQLVTLRCVLCPQDARTVTWFIAGAVYFLVMCLAVGRPYIVETLHGTVFSRGHLVPAHGCCTPAVLYDGDVVENLALYLYDADAEPYDGMIDRWTAKNGYVAYLTDPNMVKHIGMVSTGNDKAKSGAEFML